MFRSQPGECTPLGLHGAHLGSAPGTGAPGGAKAPPRFKWIADAKDAALARRAEQGSKHTGKRVQMFVRVDVADGETTGLNSAYLGDGLGLNLLLANTAA